MVTRDQLIIGCAAFHQQQIKGKALVIIVKGRMHKK